MHKLCPPPPAPSTRRLLAEIQLNGPGVAEEVPLVPPPISTFAPSIDPSFRNHAKLACRQPVSESCQRSKFLDGPPVTTGPATARGMLCISRRHGAQSASSVTFTRCARLCSRRMLHQSRRSLGSAMRGSARNDSMHIAIMRSVRWGCEPIHSRTPSDTERRGPSTPKPPRCLRRRCMHVVHGADTPTETSVIQRRTNWEHFANAAAPCAAPATPHWCEERGIGGGR